MNVLTVTLHPAIDRFIKVAQLLPNRSVSCEVLKTYSSGKGINAARVLQRLGILATATGFQGGRTGELSKDYLKEEGITPAFINCRQPTRITTIVYDASSGNHYPIYEPRQTVSKIEANELINHFAAIIDRFDFCLLCGAGEGPYLENVYQRIIKIACEKKIRCLLDSSGTSLANGIKARPYFVKINLSELSGFMNKELISLKDQIEALKTIVHTGVRFAAVSNREKGLLATDGDQIWQGRLAVNHIINTVGCGDAMSAGIAMAILKDMSLDEIVRWGVACGTTNTQNIGAGFIQLDTLKEVFPKVEVRIPNHDDPLNSKKTLSS
jgi:1-phosphofructokinase family hexose kinase